VARSLHDAAAPPAAARARRPGWRDPRLWIGIALVAASVLVGARVLAAADDTEAVWALRADAGAGETLAEDDLVSVRVRFQDADELDRYFRVDDTLPADLRLDRALGEGELLPRAALDDAERADTRQVPLAVPPEQLPPSVGPGSTVDVYLLAATPAEGDAAARTKVLEEVGVVDVATPEEGLGAGGVQQVVVSVPAAQVEPFYERLATLEAPVLAVVGTN
jgi:hypothetical protein